MLGLVADIDAFRQRWEVAASVEPERLRSLRRVATIESVASSTRIEGSSLSNADVDQLLSNLEITPFTSRDEQEVAGYADAFERILADYATIPIAPAAIRELHRTMLAPAAADAWHRGGYKTVSNAVTARDADGREVGVVFETASPADTPRLVQELTDWTTFELERGELHSLLVIGVFVVVFLEIHPFLDGNGRLSRLLTMLLLLRAGYGYVPYSSLESIIEESKSGYYRALRVTQPTIRSGKPDWTPWLTWFLRALHRQITRLQAKIDAIDAVRGDAIDDRILASVAQRGTVSIGELVEATGINRNTLKAHLRGLVNSGRLRLHGQGRGARYGR